MIVIGRAVSVLVGIFLLVFVLVTLVVLEVNDTFLDPAFYPRELERHEVYDFVLNDLLISAIDDAREIPAVEISADLDENPLVTSGLTTEEIVGSVNRALPPEFLQDLVDQSFNQMGRYLTGEIDEFSISVSAGDRIPIVVEEAKSLMRKADAYDLLFEQVVDPAVEDSVSVELPLGLEIPSQRLVEAVRAIVPPNWVRDQVEAVLDELSPYMTRDSETFEIVIPAGERAEAALEEVKVLLREIDAYELLYDEVVVTPFTEQFGDQATLPFGVVVVDTEVLSALRAVAPPSWVQEQAENIIDDAAVYMTGKSDTFATSISLVDNKSAAREQIVGLVQDKIESTIGGIPTCTSPQDVLQASRQLRPDATELPSCLPPGTPIDLVLDLVDIDFGDQVDQFVLSSVPDEIVFTDRDLRNELVRAGAADNLDRIDEVRDILTDGYIYTNVDLREDLIREPGPFATEEERMRNVDTLEDVRSFLSSEGWTFTHVDFRERLDEARSRPSSDSFDDPIFTLDFTRDVFDASRTFRWLAYLPMVVLLVLMGFLGGRTWPGRLAWASGSLLIVSLLVFVGFGIAYGAVSDTGFDEARRQAINGVDILDDFAATQRLAIDKGFEVVTAIADRFTSGIATSALNLAVIGLIGMLVGIFWRELTRAVDSLEEMVRGRS